MSQVLPGVVSTTLTALRYLIDRDGLRYGEDVVLDSTNTDAGSSPTYRIRPGNVVQKRTSTGRYVEANDPNADHATGPVITSLIAGSAAWASKIVLLKSGAVTVASVTLGAGDDTTSEIVTALNANADFDARAVASGGDGSPLVITGKEAGSQAQLRVSIDLTTAFAVINGSSSEDSGAGTDPDVRVVDSYADLQDHNGTAVNAPVRALVAGYFDESELVNLTGEAKAVLARRGSRFG